MRAVSSAQNIMIVTEIPSINSTAGMTKSPSRSQAPNSTSPRTGGPNMPR